MAPPVSHTSATTDARTQRGKIIHGAEGYKSTNAKILIRMPFGVTVNHAIARCAKYSAAPLTTNAKLVAGRVQKRGELAYNVSWTLIAGMRAAREACVTI